jgi:hypothetical protein
LPLLTTHPGPRPLACSHAAATYWRDDDDVEMFSVHGNEPGACPLPPSPPAAALTHRRTTRLPRRAQHPLTCLTRACPSLVSLPLLQTTWAT